MLKGRLRSFFCELFDRARFPSNRTSLILRNDISAIALLSQRLEEFARIHDLSEKLIFNVNLSLEEVVSNIIAHAYTDSKEHLIHVELELKDGMLTVTVEDDGIAFNPENLPAPDVSQEVDARPVGGLGIHFVRNFMDTMQYERSNDHNILTLTKATQPFTRQASERRTDDSS